MGIFRHFPYTNFHDLNLDWILAKIKELWEGVFEINKKVDDFIYNTEPLIRDEVDNWLDSHPEATTTVQDNSLTTPKYQDGSVTGEKIADHAISEIKLSEELFDKLYIKPFQRDMDNMTVIQQQTCYFVDDNAHHIAFPSVIDAGSDNIYMAYREATGHLDYDGEIVLKYGSYTNLSNYARIAVTGEDCRDPKLVYFDNKFYCLFTTRIPDQPHKVYAADISDPLDINPVLINSYFIGGQPIVDDGTIYIPCYSDNTLFIAYGTSLWDLDIMEIAAGYNEAAICKSGDDFIMMCRNALDNNGYALYLKTKDFDTYDVKEEIPLSAQCPALLNMNDLFILFAYRSTNKDLNVNKYSGELDILTLGMDGSVLDPVINLFAGGNTDLGYVSMCLQSSGRLIIAFYLAFRHSICVMSIDVNDWIGHRLYGDVMFRNISRQNIDFTNGKRYELHKPLGTHRIASWITSIPSDTISVLNSHHLYIRTYNERYLLLIAEGNSTKPFDSKILCVQNKFNSPDAYNNAANTDGTYLAV